ncbi:hypothetical protein [Niallia sp. NCCP-28]|uniref:hypothetical protein n=1 Tax=Niallia sp. NCCP-28 TaxID=2934712 RepID=UPI0020824907|nr:hypothetical protein [Niallia sp. NCCP-28]GKU83498.1 hypothetical protein NCCP28_28940 [Niallia sp. NCCP-28]
MYYPPYYPYYINDYRIHGAPPVPPFPPQGSFPIPDLGNLFPGFPGGQSSPPGFSGGGSDQGPPSGPPPSYTPQLQQQTVSTFAVDAGSMRRCLHRFTYVWLENGRGFWFYPTFVGRTSVAGYRWRNFRWVFYGTDTNRIRSFQCT